MIGLVAVDLRHRLGGRCVRRPGQTLHSRRFLRRLHGGRHSMGRRAPRSWSSTTRPPKAFCAGLLRPRVHVSEGALRLLDAPELLAVVTHEAHHVRRRDPLRVVMVRSLVRSLPWAPGLGRLAERHATVAELAADGRCDSEGRIAPAPRRGARRDRRRGRTTGARHRARARRPSHGQAAAARPRPTGCWFPAGLSLGLLSLAVVIGVVPGGSGRLQRASQRPVAAPGGLLAVGGGDAPGLRGRALRGSGGADPRLTRALPIRDFSPVRVSQPATLDIGRLIREADIDL